MYKYHRSQHDSISFVSRHRSVAPDRGLLDEKKVEDTSQFVDKVEETVDVWQDIATALENWTQRILDIESHHTTSGKCSSSNRRIVQETATRWIVNSPRYC